MNPGLVGVRGQHFPVLFRSLIPLALGLERFRGELMDLVGVGITVEKGLGCARGEIRKGVDNDIKDFRVFGELPTQPMDERQRIVLLIELHGAFDAVQADAARKLRLGHTRARFLESR